MITLRCDCSQLVHKAQIGCIKVKWGKGKVTRERVNGHVMAKIKLGECAISANDIELKPDAVNDGIYWQSIDHRSDDQVRLGLQVGSH